MAGLSDAGRNAKTNGFTAAATHGSLHTADPGTTGTSEVTGGAPAYARKTLTWSASAAGTATITNDPVFDVPGGTTISYMGYWTAATAGTFLGSRPLDVPQTFASQGTYTPGGGTAANPSESTGA